MIYFCIPKSPVLKVDSLLTESTGKPLAKNNIIKKKIKNIIEKNSVRKELKNRGHQDSRQ